MRHDNAGNRASTFCFVIPPVLKVGKDCKLPILSNYPGKIMSLGILSRSLENSIVCVGSADLHLRLSCYTADIFITGRIERLHLRCIAGQALDESCSFHHAKAVTDLFYFQVGSFFFTHGIDQGGTGGFMAVVQRCSFQVQESCRLVGVEVFE